VEPLITVLKDNDDNVRVLAIISLGGIGDARAVEPLISTLKDDNKRVRNFAAKALKKIGGEKAEQYLKDYKKQNPWYKRL
jgi:HEAT repeat protein